MTGEPSARQKRIWTTAPPGDVPREVLSLLHPAFTRPHHITSHFEGFSCLVRGELVEVVPHGFQVKMPSLDASGRYEFQITLFNSGPMFARELVNAGRSGQSILADYHVYGSTGIDPIRPALRWTLSGIAAQGIAVSAIATLGDFVNQPFPPQAYVRRLYPGLDRI